MRKSPEQDIYDTLYILLQEHRIIVRDALPMEGTPVAYPFVVIGDIQNVSNGTKTSRNGLLNITLNVWGDAKQRKVVTEIAQGILSNILGSWHSETYNYIGYANQQNITIMKDNTVPNRIYNRALCQFQLNIN